MKSPGGSKLPGGSQQLIEITELIGPLKAAEMSLYYSPDLRLMNVDLCDSNPVT